MNPRDQAIEVGAQMIDLMGTTQVRKFSILDRRFQRLVKSLTTIEDIDYVLDELRRRYPQHNREGGILSR